MLTALGRRQYNLYYYLAIFGLFVTFLLVIAIVFSFLLKESIETDLNKVNVEAELRKAVRDEVVMNTWDELQIRKPEFQHFQKCTLTYLPVKTTNHSEKAKSEFNFVKH